MFLFYLQVSFETFLILRSIQRDIVIKVHMFPCINTRSSVEIKRQTDATEVFIADIIDSLRRYIYQNWNNTEKISMAPAQG